MKKTLALIAALVIMTAASATFSQSSRIVTTVTTQEQDPAFSLGRDFWFAPAQNFTDQSGKFIQIYITSTSNTTAYVESQGIVKSVQVSADAMATFNVPLSWEMKSSCIVENKGIHVYDPTDDIEVYLMSHNQNSAEGMYCIPTIGWGTDYVVAAYESLFESFDTTMDEPSEITITADQDNTEVTVTPAVDCRLSTQYPAGATTVGAPLGRPFQFTLNQGQSLQMQALKATNTDNFDLTGTIIHSNVGVSVVGASMSANIPPDFPYPNYITEMIPPVRTWAETYYTTNSIQPVGEANKDENLYLMISTVPGQTIYRFSPTQGLITEGVLGPKYDHLYAEEEGPNKWYSDQPFLLVEYLNSATYPDGVNGSGDPAEVVIPAEENYSKSFLFTAPANSQNNYYDNYANIIVNVNDIDNVKFDGKPITSYTHEAIDREYEIYIIPHIDSGTHTVTSDSGAAVYLYGYGNENSYAWEGPSFVGTFHSPDTIPPIVKITGECFQEYIHITDSGYLPGSTQQNPLVQSGLNEIRLDTDINMAYLPNPYPNWIDGSALDTAGLSMFVIDPTKPAKLVVDIFDAAGNRTTITSVYTPQDATIEPQFQDFGIVIVGQSAAIRYDTIVNTGQVPFNFTTLRLEYGNRGFTIDSVPASPIGVGQKELVKILFYPVQQTIAVDSIIFGDQCTTQDVALLGSGGAADFYVTNVVWQNAPLNPPANAKTGANPGGWIPMAAEIHNESANDTLHVTCNGWGDHVHFVLWDTANGGGPQTFPVTVPAGTQPTKVWFLFEPTSVARTATQAAWTAKEVDSTDGNPEVKFDSLNGNAITPSLTFTGDTTVTLECADTTIRSVTLEFLLSNNGTQDAVINRVILSDPTDFTNLTGYDQHGFSWNPAAQPVIIPPGAVDTIKATVFVNTQSNSSVMTQIIALDAEGDTIGGAVLNASVTVSYRAADVSQSTILIGPVPYQSGKVTKSFTITNTATSTLELFPFSFEPGSQYNSSYSFTTTPAFADSLTLSAGQQVTITVTFDPSVSTDSVQSVILNLNGNWCDALNELITARVTYSHSSVAEEIAPTSLASVIMLDDGKSIQIIIPSDWVQPEDIDIYNILGETVYTSSLDGSSTFDLSTLPRGVYFYRLRESDRSQTGKILLGQ